MALKQSNDPSQEEPKMTARQKFNELVGVVGSFMSRAEVERLPADTAGYVNGIMRKALENVDRFKDKLKEVISYQYYNSPKGERFIYDPIRNGALMIDAQGEIVTLMGADIAYIPKDLEGEYDQYIKEYKECMVLTGSDRGRKFSPQQRPIPRPPLV